MNVQVNYVVKYWAKIKKSNPNLSESKGNFTPKRLKLGFQNRASIR